MVDYALPLLAVPTVGNAKPIAVQINPKYAGCPGYVPVKFPVNMWADGGPAGTWYFDAAGRSFGGKGPDGDNGRYYLRNA